MLCVGTGIALFTCSEGAVLAKLSPLNGFVLNKNGIGCMPSRWMQTCLSL